MTDRLNRMIADAERRGEAVAADEPRATSARYDAASGRLIIELTNGCGLLVPARGIQGLEDAPDNALTEVEILGLGLGLHWEQLDVDVSIPGLLAGLFGTKAWMDRQRAAKAGSARSPAKAEAARRNGAKGGRPSRKITTPGG